MSDEDDKLSIIKKLEEKYGDMTREELKDSIILSTLAHNPHLIPKVLANIEEDKSKD